MPRRRPQINFQVDPSMKTLYDEAYAEGHWVTRLCAAGLLLMIEEPATRQRAISRLREWEAKFEDASAEKIRSFVQHCAGALQTRAPKSQQGRKAPRSQKTVASK